jgi:hypothetical protein
LLRSMFRTAIVEGDHPVTTAMTVLNQFINLAGPANPNVDQWTFQVLHELSKDPAPVGMYATAVSQAVCRIIRSGFEYEQ